MNTTVYVTMEYDPDSATHAGTPVLVYENEEDAKKAVQKHNDAWEKWTKMKEEIQGGVNIRTCSHRTPEFTFYHKETHAWYQSVSAIKAVVKWNEWKRSKEGMECYEAWAKGEEDYVAVTMVKAD